MRSRTRVRVLFIAAASVIALTIAGSWATADDDTAVVDVNNMPPVTIDSSVREQLDSALVFRAHLVEEAIAAETPEQAAARERQIGHIDVMIADLCDQLTAPPCGCNGRLRCSTGVDREAYAIGCRQGSRTDCVVGIWGWWAAESSGGPRRARATRSPNENARSASRPWA